MCVESILKVTVFLYPGYLPDKRQETIKIYLISFIAENSEQLSIYSIPLS